MKKSPTVAPVDPLALRGLTTHAESHWLTFATAMRCYEQQPSQPELQRAADRHGPTWLRAALHGEKIPKKTIRRPKELDPKTGSLAYLTRGAEEALKKPEEKPKASVSIAPVVQPTPRIQKNREL